MDVTQNAITQAEAILKSGKYKVRATFTDGSKETLRLFTSSHGYICYFRRRSRRKGYPLYDLPNLVSVEPITSQKSKEQKWRDEWLKVIARLKKSGLWENVIEEIETALSMAISPDAPAEGVVTNEITDRFKKWFGVDQVGWIISFPHTTINQIMEEKAKHNYIFIHQKVQGGWEFGINDPECMSVEVNCNGEIELDWSTSEEIFNYVND